MLAGIILYGAGERCRHLCKLLQQLKYEGKIIIIDSNSEKWGNTIEGWKVESPNRIREVENADLYITIADTNVIKEIRKDIVQKYCFNLNREITYNQLIIRVYKRSLLIKQNLLEKEFSKKKNIIFESSEGLGLGGVEAWTKDICTALIENGEENLYIISDAGSYEIPEALWNRVIYANINHKRYYTVDVILELIELISKKLPCKIVINFPNDVMLAAYLIKSYYPDLIDIISVIHVGRENLYGRFLDYKEGIDSYVAVSQDIKEAMLNKAVDLPQFFSMTCPFKCEQLLVRTYTQDYEKPIRIGYAGRMDGMEESQKRMDLVLKLIVALEEKGVNYKMELAGNGAARNSMEDFICSRHLEEKVQFLGTIERSELDIFWQRQDICINLADFEGRSISIIEAMGNGAVPVVTATSGVREDITNDMNGYIVSLGDYCAMAERIEYLSKHRERLHEMGQKAHDVVYPKSLMEPHLELWKEILGIREREHRNGCNR